MADTNGPSPNLLSRHSPRAKIRHFGEDVRLRRDDSLIAKKKKGRGACETGEKELRRMSESEKCRKVTVN